MKCKKENYAKETIVGLMAAEGKESFDKKFGFFERSNKGYSTGIIQYINK